MQIFVNVAQSTRTLVVNVDSFDTVDVLKLRVKEKIGLDSDNLTLDLILLYGGCHLRGKQALWEYGISNGSTIECRTSVLSENEKHSTGILMPTGRLYFYGDQEEKTVASLKRLIEKEEGYGFLEQSLVLGKANISNRELLSTVLKRSKASGLPLTLMLPGMIRIFVKSSKESFFATVYTHDTIKEVKLKLMARKGYDSHRQHLAFRDRELNDSESVKSCNIIRDSTVLLILGANKGNIDGTATDIAIQRLKNLCQTLESENKTLKGRLNQLEAQNIRMTALAETRETERRRAIYELEEYKAQKSQLQERCRSLEEERTAAMREVEDYKSQKLQLTERCENLETQNRKRLDEIEAQRLELVRSEGELEDKRVELRGLRASLAESQRRLDEYIDVLTIDKDQVSLTQQKLGSGAYADVVVGHWHGMKVAVKKFHELITTPYLIPMFQREVRIASRLHHPNIIRVCGAIMSEGHPLQIVSELLQGSVSELIIAARASGSRYLTTYEQLSIAIEITSAIAYLHQLMPRPYVHGDIRPTNVLVTRDMKVKVGDLGATHFLESRSVGPVSANYLAPERFEPISAHSSLPSDVYSLGVSLIEILIGVSPIRDERNRQLGQVANQRRLYLLCSRMIADERNVKNRPTSSECLEELRTEMDDCLESGKEPLKRLVMGKFDSRNNRHWVTLSDSFYL
ncbi:uncharacterized protein [Oscarella lobularis]|uniref:uncharacterized protein isoform X2 n=1 Tax=Oscarella lobularis TaxID=121494 RepID=UPI003313C48A